MFEYSIDEITDEIIDQCNHKNVLALAEALKKFPGHLRKDGGGYIYSLGNERIVFSIPENAGEGLEFGIQYTREFRENWRNYTEWTHLATEFTSNVFDVYVTCRYLGGRWVQG